MQRKKEIEQEFDEPLRDVVTGFADMGYSMPYVAETLEVSVSSVKHFCSSRNQRIHFSRSPQHHREIPGRPARRIRHNGQEKTLNQWAWDLGLSVEGVRKRIKKRGAPCC